MAGPALAPGDLLEVSFFCSLVNQLGVNRLRYLVTNSVGGGITLDMVPSLMGSKFGELIRPLMSAAAMFRGTGVRRLVPAPVTISYYSTDESGIGTGTGAQLPSQVSPVIRLQTETSGPKGRGRLYVSFPASSAADGNGNLADAYKGTMALFASDLGPTVELADAGSFLDLQLVITKSPPGALQYVINQYPTGKFGTQKRRGNYGEPNDFPV